MWKIVLLVLLVSSCSSFKKNKKLTEKEIIKKQIMALRVVRPILKSDEFPYMKCQEVEKVKVEKDNDFDNNLWQSFGVMELRQKAVESKSNLMSLEHFRFGKINKYSATLFRCDVMNDASYVDNVGMCKASSERVFKIKYPSDSAREVGKEILIQKIRYYAIANHYKTYSFQDIKYSFTRKEFIGKAAFFKCL